jgi:hypothetical protein
MLPATPVVLPVSVKVIALLNFQLARRLCDYRYMVAGPRIDPRFVRVVIGGAGHSVRLEFGVRGLCAAGNCLLGGQRDSGI